MFPEHKYKFTHDLLYETVKQSVPEQTWKEKNQQIANFLYDVYKNEMIVQGDRIADFFIKGNIDQNSFEPIFEAAKIALSQKRYSNAIKYFEETVKIQKKLNLSINYSNLFEPYTEALFASGNKDNIENALEKWGKTKFDNDEDEIRYYKKYLEFLFIYREMDKLPDIAKFAINRFNKEIFKEDRFGFKIRYCQALAYLIKFDEAIHLSLKLLRSLNGHSKSSQKIDLYYGLGFMVQQIGVINVASYITLLAKEIADQDSNLKQKVEVHKRIGFLASAQGYYKEALRIWSDLSFMTENQGYFLQNNF
ncbi:MAG: hypothetical protein R2877_08095 [Bdellovibrionota bacterium]